MIKSSKYLKDIDVFGPGWVATQIAAYVDTWITTDCTRQYRLLHKTCIAYRDTVYTILVTPWRLLVTHINQLVNFTVEFGGEKETVLASRNYTKLTAGQ